MIRACDGCGRSYKTFPSYLKRRPAGGYCSKKCYGKACLRHCARCARELAPNRKTHCTPCAGLLRHERSVARFNAHIDKTGDCWVWNGAINPNGYGAATVGKAKGFAHRVQWMLTHGPIPKKQCVCHRCDNPRCVNPDHLFLGTYRDNIHDSMQKGRFLAWATTGVTLSGRPARRHGPQPHCRRGHLIQTAAKGYRFCRECNQRRAHAYYLRHRRQERVAS